MTIALRVLKVKVMVQANAVGPTSIEGSFFLATDSVSNAVADRLPPFVRPFFSTQSFELGDL